MRVCLKIKAKQNHINITPPQVNHMNTTPKSLIKQPDVLLLKNKSECFQSDNFLLFASPPIIAPHVPRLPLSNVMMLLQALLSVVSHKRNAHLLQEGDLRIHIISKQVSNFLFTESEDWFLFPRVQAGIAYILYSSCNISLSELTILLMGDDQIFNFHYYGNVKSMLWYLQLCTDLRVSVGRMLGGKIGRSNLMSS